jgi:hypothetical protein
MKGGSNIVSAIHALRQGFDHFESFEKDHPGSKGAQLFANYRKKIEWVYKDLLTNPHLTEPVREGIRREWKSDVFSVPAINEKIPLLNPEQRDLIETIIDALLKGETIKLDK